MASLNTLQGFPNSWHYGLNAEQLTPHDLDNLFPEVGKKR
ncbi:hypothetical protein MC7420_2805 [Coleofasciculus chthonoplastes PCC 7420]|uniref:Uncharacterized protein n=1 Tax=Coleofasciculus chthonoplastes PCC 7420 TaxID=118168 RepID=B4W3P0_9CYAN|nr:hypothetical protein MC7420_2805 [Coleofasciculus chthonoplastes PCC 7420]